MLQCMHFSSPSEEAATVAEITGYCRPTRKVRPAVSVEVGHSQAVGQHEDVAEADRREGGGVAVVEVEAHSAGCAKGGKDVDVAVEIHVCGSHLLAVKEGVIDDRGRGERRGVGHVAEPAYSRVRACRCGKHHIEQPVAVDISSGDAVRRVDDRGGRIDAGAGRKRAVAQAAVPDSHTNCGKRAAGDNVGDAVAVEVRHGEDVVVERVVHGDAGCSESEARHIGAACVDVAVDAAAGVATDDVATAVAVAVRHGDRAGRRQRCHSEGGERLVAVVAEPEQLAGRGREHICVAVAVHVGLPQRHDVVVRLPHNPPGSKLRRRVARSAGASASATAV
eukprot:m.57964 g.57964  ORF g.57964 m.57964 type:complete len:335 (+) comp13502_c0_seq1:522-1526(+)